VSAAPVESEIKLKAASPAAAREALARVGADLARARHLENNVVFQDAHGVLGAQASLLRLRRTPDISVLTFKGPRQIVDGVKSREEIEVDVSDADALQLILERLGYRTVFRYQKYREVYHWQDLEIVVDETPVGTFFEIEGPISAIHKAASALGYGPKDYITESYAALYVALGGEGDMVF
jgi:adenylate cyclase class 2